MNPFHIRPAQAADAAVIRVMIKHERLDPLNVHWQNFLIAEEANRIVGIGQIKPYPGARELGSLVVAPDRRKSGVGAAIINALIERERGPLVLFCLAFRERYYAKFGFRRATLRELPASLKIKYVIGLVFTRLFRQRLIVMIRPCARKRCQPHPERSGGRPSTSLRSAQDAPVA